MVLRGNKKSEEEKMRNKMSIQESYNTGSIEQQELQRKQKNKKPENSPTFDVKSIRNLIEKTLKGKIVKYTHWRDSETGDIKTEKNEIETTNRKLCNEDAANRYLNYTDNVLNHQTISSFLQASQIEKMTLGTMGPVYDETIFKHHINGIGYKNTEDAASIISTIRNPVITALNKSRNGRMIESQEKVRVEKSVENTSSENQDSSSNRPSLFS